MHVQTKHACPECVAELTESVAEQEIVDFIREIYKGEIIRHDREILNKMEIDILLPDIGLGIEHHGMYWHNESVVGANCHRNKADLANKKGIRLLQIYEPEWVDEMQVSSARQEALFSARMVAIETVMPDAATQHEHSDCVSHGGWFISEVLL